MYEDHCGGASAASFLSSSLCFKSPLMRSVVPFSSSPEIGLPREAQNDHVGCPTSCQELLLMRLLKGKPVRIEALF